MDIKATVETRPFANTFSEAVSNVVGRELKYCKPSGKQTTDGNFVGVLNYNTDWIRNVDERIAVQYELSQLLWKNGMHNEDGRPKMFSPVIVPFHIAESGEPATQLRVFFYRPKQQDGETRIPQSTIIVRCEPYGTEVAFDKESKYATTEPVAQVA